MKALDPKAMLEKNSRRESSGCLVWTGRTNCGYGTFGTKLRAHRVAWELANGRPVPPGLMVRHKCDNPPCIEPTHLEIGTAADNSRDAVERGRTARGARNPQTVLSEDKVQMIRWLRRRGWKRSLVARAFGVDKTTVRGMEQGDAWRYLPYVSPEELRPHASAAEEARLGALSDACAMRGERQTGAKLTKEKVLQIPGMLALGLLHKEIAKALGVTRTTIGEITSGRNWRHLFDDASLARMARNGRGR